MTELSPREARRILRREILRRSRWPLAVVALLIAAGLTFFAMGFPVLTMTIQGAPEAPPVDNTLRLVLIISALALSLALMRGEHRGLRPLLSRLPVAPTATLRVRLELGLACGVVVLAMAFMIEYLASPVMLRPSFPGRLNPVERQALEYLPGVPLLRFAVDGQVHRGLTSASSLLAMRQGGLQAYGERHLWPHLRGGALPRPGDVIVRLDAATWSTLDDHQKERLLRRGIPEGAVVEVALERYVPREEYTSQPWRRDGLLRDRRWHAADRAFGFLVLLVASLSVAALATNLAQTLAMLYFVALFPVMLFPGLLNGKPSVLVTDLDRGQVLTEVPTLPTLPLLHQPWEYWIWPGLLCLVSVLICTVSARTIQHGFQKSSFISLERVTPIRPLRAPRPVERLWLYVALFSPAIVFLLIDGDFEVFTRNSTSLSIGVILLFGLSFVLKERLRKVARALEVLACILLLIGLVFPSSQNIYWTPFGAWLLSLLVICFGAIYPPIVWARREALLSRLPVEHMTLANRRIGSMLLAFIAVALLPVALEVMTVPGNRWPAKSLFMVFAGLLCLCLVLVISSPRMAGIVPPLVFLFLSRPIIDGPLASHATTMPGPVWWISMTLATLFLAAAAHTLIRRRLAIGGSLLPVLRRWLERRWQKLWDATDARRHGVARNV